MIGVGLYLLLPVCAQADTFNSLREVIRKTLADKSVPSVTVAVSRHGQIVWEEGFGWADRENSVRATPLTPYTLGSVSKPLTATLVMALVGQGKLALDQPLNAYLGDTKLRARVGD